MMSVELTDTARVEKAEAEARVLARTRDLLALERFDTYYKDLRDDKKAYITRKADHHLLLRQYVEEAQKAGKPMRVGVRAFEAYWRGTGPDAAALEARAQQVYKVAYVSLCCGKKRAVYDAVLTGEK